MTDRQPLPPAPPASSASTVKWWHAALLALLFANAVLLLRLLWLCRAGLDFTDEGFYLNWISNPWLYPTSHTQFGFVYHPFHVLLGGDLAWLRRANLLATCGLAGWFFFRVLQQILEPGFPTDLFRGKLVSLSMIFSTSALLYLYQWLPTPNYNSLALQALLLVAIGLLGVERSSSASLPWFSISLVAVGGWLAFMAKPTTASLLALFVAGYFCSLGRRAIPLIASAGVLAILLLAGSAWMIDGSPVRFAWRLSEGAADVGKLGGGYNIAHILRLGRFPIPAREVLPLCTHVLLVTAGLLFASRPSASPRIQAAYATGLVATGLTGAFLFWRGLPWPHPTYFGLQILAPVGGALLAALITFLCDRSQAHRSGFSLSLLFLMLPYAYTFGSNGDYWVSQGWAGIFWIAAGLLFLRAARPGRIAWPELLPVATATTLCASLILGTTTEYPYRQTGPLRENTHAISMRPDGPRLWIKSDFHAYLSQVQEATRQAGFVAGTPMIDLTGHYPTTLYFLQARAIGLAWLCGGYPGSEAMTTAALDRVPPDILHQAWILTEPQGPRKLPPSMLRRYGINLETDYAIVTTVDSPTGTYPDSYKQHVLKPVDPRKRLGEVR
jgi:hypothetical protein